MPELSDYDPNDDDQGGSSAGFTPAQDTAVDKQTGTASGAPKEAARTPVEEQQYTPWSRFTSANSDVSEREANRVTGRVQGDVDRSKKDLADAQTGFDQSFGANYASNEAPADFAADTATSQAPWASFGGSTDTTAVSSNLPANTVGSVPLPPPLPPGPPPGPAPAPPDKQADQPAAQTTPTAAAPAAAAPQAQPTTYNPWETLSGGGSATPQVAGPTKPPPPPGYVEAPQGLQPAQATLSDADRQGQLTEEAMAGGAGAHDLEAAAGQPAWTQLIGDTVTASNEANALGSEAGLQSILQRDNPNAKENSAFDAALLEGQGQEDFEGLAGKYGKGQLEDDVVKAEQASQDRWKQLQGDIDARQQRDAAKAAVTGQPATTSKPGADPSDTDSSSGGGDGSNLNIHDVLFGGEGQKDAWSVMHEAGISLSPADQADIAIAESTGEDIDMPTEAFVSAITGALAKETHSSWPAAKVEMAYGRLASQYPPQALQALLRALKTDKSMMNKYLAMKNPGYMARQMRMWLEQQGFQQRGAKDNIHETRTFGNEGTTYTDPTGQQRTTSDAQEQARTYAYRQGWGQQWDEQFNNGVDDPQRQ